MKKDEEFGGTASIFFGCVNRLSLLTIILVLSDFPYHMLWQFAIIYPIA